MIAIKAILVIGLIALGSILSIIAAVGLAYTVVGILIGITDGKEGLGRYDKMIDRETEELKKSFRNKK